MADRVRIIEGDLFKHDFTRATVLTLYLLPEINLQLRPQILAMKPGTRVVSNTFTMAEWEPDQTIKGKTFDAYLWIVPAQVGGRWSVADEGGKEVAVVDIAQQFQKIGGTILVGGKAQPLLGAFVSGREIGFSYHDATGLSRGPPRRRRRPRDRRLAPRRAGSEADRAPFVADDGRKFSARRPLAELALEPRGDEAAVAERPAGGEIGLALPAQQHRLGVAGERNRSSIRRADPARRAARRSDAVFGF